MFNTFELSVEYNTVVAVVTCLNNNQLLPPWDDYITSSPHSTAFMTLPLLLALMSAADVVRLDVGDRYRVQVASRHLS